MRGRGDEAEQLGALAGWWDGVAAVLDSLERRFARPLVGFTDLVADLRAAADTLCGEALWRGPAGRALAGVVAALEAHGHHLDPFAPADAPPLVAAFLGETPVRTPYGGHPRLAIYGALEARLQRADLTILGGLNEGVWPGRPSPTRGSRRSCAVISRCRRSNARSALPRTISCRRSAGRRCC